MNACTVDMPPRAAQLMTGSEHDGADASAHELLEVRAWWLEKSPHIMCSLAHPCVSSHVMQPRSYSSP